MLFVDRFVQQKTLEYILSKTSVVFKQRPKAETPERTDT